MSKNNLEGSVSYPPWPAHKAGAVSGRSEENRITLTWKEDGVEYTLQARADTKGGTLKGECLPGGAFVELEQWSNREDPDRLLLRGWCTEGSWRYQMDVLLSPDEESAEEVIG